MLSQKSKKSIEELFKMCGKFENTKEKSRTLFGKLTEEFQDMFVIWFCKIQKHHQRKIVSSYKQNLLILQNMINKQLFEIDQLEKNFHDSEARAYELLRLDAEMNRFFIKRSINRLAYSANYVDRDIYDIYLFTEHCNNIVSYQKNILDNSKFSEVCMIGDCLNFNDIRSKLMDIFDQVENYFYQSINMKVHSKFNVCFLSACFSDHISPMTNIEIENLRAHYYANVFRANIEECILKRRQELNMTQAQLATYSGVDRSMIAKVEKSHQNASMETLVKLLTALNMKISLLPMCDDEIACIPSANIKD